MWLTRFFFFFFHFAEACNFNQVSFVCRRLFIFFFGLFVFPLPWGNDLRKHCCHCSVTQSCPTPWETPLTTACQASLSFTSSRSLLKLTCILVMPSNHLGLCRPLLLLPQIFPSIRVFSSESAFHIRLPSYWSFSFSISPSNEYSGLISFRMD